MAVAMMATTSRAVIVPAMSHVLLDQFLGFHGDLNSDQ
jgi:hypothetical protein